MQSRVLIIVCALITGLLVACSDGSDSRSGGGNTPNPQPEVSLDETGIYSGTMVTQNGDVALMSLVLARDGTTAITLETDDSERATVVLWGVSDGDNGEITFTGSDTSNDGAVSIDILVTGDEASGTLTLAGIRGVYQLVLESFSARVSNLQAIAGSYARDDTLSGLSELSISEDGVVQLRGGCEATGSVSEIDNQVNLYRLTLDSDCIALDVLVSLQDIEVEEDVLSLTGDGGDSGIARDFYRL
jgi:hypothetical protein